MWRLLAVGTALAAGCAAQLSEEDFRVQGEHPRLLLNSRRLKLLRRERERQSMRWQQLALLIDGKARMPESGFALALYSEVSEKPEACREAARAVSGDRDLRQAALVYDWCAGTLDAAANRALATRLKDALRPAPSKDIDTLRSRAFAAIALAGEAPDVSERALRSAVADFRTRVRAALDRGENPIPQPDVYALTELLHAVRDSLDIDLRECAPQYFKDLPTAQMLGYYPAPYQAPENEFRIPIYPESGEPDLKLAALSRAADLALVAYDSNSLEAQFLQGWLIHDRFLMRGALGIVYEFLWANPYHPGLSYFHTPLTFHDERTGRLFLRSTWEDDATWFGYQNGQMQLFRDGRPSIVKGHFPALRVGDATVAPARSPAQFKREVPTVYLVGLRPRAAYDVETDDEEMYEAGTDAAGTLVLQFAKGSKDGFRIKDAGAKP